MFNVVNKDWLLHIMDWWDGCSYRCNKHGIQKWFDISMLMMLEQQLVFFMPSGQSEGNYVFGLTLRVPSVRPSFCLSVCHTVVSDHYLCQFYSYLIETSHTHYHDYLCLSSDTY